MQNNTSLGLQSSIANNMAMIGNTTPQNTNYLQSQSFTTPTMARATPDPFQLFSTPTNAPQRNIPTIPGIIGTVPNFSGDTDAGDNIEQFFNSLERAGRTGAWDDETKLAILQSKLKGKALKHYNEGIGLNFDISYEDTKTHLIQNYKSKESEAEITERLFKTLQKVDESVDSYYFRLRGIVNKLRYNEEIKKDLIINKFLDGLKHEIAKHVILKNPKNIEEALNYAKEMEDIEMRLLRKFKKSMNVVEVKEPINEAQKSEIEQLKLEIMNISRNINKLSIEKNIEHQSNIDKHIPRIIICEKCKRHNHTESRCHLN